MAYHNEPLTGGERETLAEFGEGSPNLSTTFGMVQVEIGIYAGGCVNWLRRLPAEGVIMFHAADEK